MKEKIYQFLSAVCAFLFVVSAILTGTLAWNNEQYVVNDLFGRKTQIMTVKLIKLEKQNDDTAEEIPIPGTTFYLFKKNGEQVGGRYVTGESGEVSVKLSSGSYYFEEAYPSAGYTYDIDEDGEPVTQYPFVVEEQEEIIEIKAYNRRLQGDLIIRKTVENADGSELTQEQLDTYFEFTVTFSDGGSYPYTIDEGEEQYALASGETLRLCHGQSAVFQNLPVGLLYDVLETPVEGYTIINSGHRGNITETQSVAEFVNRAEELSAHKYGSIAVTKAVEGEETVAGTEYVFDITFEGEGAPEATRFTLKNGETKTISRLPVGITYTVTEQENSDYYALPQTYSGQIANSSEIALIFTNTYAADPDQPGRLMITKEVLGELPKDDPASDPESQEESDVLAENSDQPLAGNDAANDQDSVASSGSDSDAHDNNSTQEADTGTGEETTGEENVGGEGAGEEDISEADVGGEDTIPEPSNQVSTDNGQMMLETDLPAALPGGESAEEDLTQPEEKGFKIRVTIEGENEPREFSVNDGESIVIEDLPHGVAYTVEEIDSGEYVPVVGYAEGAIAGGKTIEVTIINDVEVPVDPDKPEETTTIVVTKELDGDYPAGALEKEFAMKLTVDSVEYDFTLKPGQSTDPFEVPVGADYEISEQNYFSEGFSQSVTKGSGTTATEEINAVVTNTYVGQPVVTITGSKTWQMGEHTEISLPASITIQLYNKETLVEEAVVLPDTNEEWNFSFTVPRDNPDGSLAEYTVKELPVPGYLTSCKFDPETNTALIVNIYMPPIKVDPPIITKIVKGDNAPETEFNFVFEGALGAPMPEGSQGNRKYLSLTGAGELEIGFIEFTEPDEYVYTVRELNNNENGWTCDKTEYEIIITVTVDENTGELSYERSIRKNNTDADEVVFTNTYDEKTLEDNIIIKVTKTWNHRSNPERNHPDSIIVKVYGNGELAASQKITERDGWEYAFELPRLDDNGEEIVYTIRENNVSGYRTKIDGYEIINTYIGSVDDDDDDPYYPVEPDKPDKPGKPAVDDDSPDTGDHSNTAFWLAMMMTSLFGLALTVCFEQAEKERKKKYRRRRL